MNRLKVWLFVLLVGAAAVAAVRFAAGAERRVIATAMDARLGVATAQVAAAIRTLSTETAAVAALAAQDPKLREHIHAKEAASPPARGRRVPPPVPVDLAAEEAVVQAAARSALGGAERAAAVTLPGSAVLYAMSRDAHARKAQDAAAGEQALVDALGAAIGGESRTGWLRWSDRLWYSAAVPAGEGAGLVLLVPVDSEWLQGVANAAGADVTLVAPDVKRLSTVRSGDVDALVQAAARGGGTPRDAGRLAPTALNVLGARIAKPALLFLAGTPAYRVQSLPVRGLEGATAIVSTPAAPLATPFLEAQWTILAAALVLVVVGLLVGVLVRPSEIAAPVPPELLGIADKIARGDFTARAPTLAGQLGTVAAALNRAVDAASAAASTSPAAPSLTQEFFAGGEKAAAAAAAPEPDSTAFVLPPRPPPAPLRAGPIVPPPAPEAPALGGGAFEAAPVPAPSRPAPLPVAAAPELLQAAARAAAPADAAGEEGHWREVFEDFLRVRADCGEPAEGLTFDRFRAKLESNKATLVQKYACRTVRFQVYVKEGKAALKATPVR
jgi:hypothetical protein